MRVCLFFDKFKIKTRRKHGENAVFFLYIKLLYSPCKKQVGVYVEIHKRQNRSTIR